MSGPAAGAGAPVRAAVDVLIVALATTAGWRAAARELAAAIERAGASVAVATAARTREVRTLMATDLAQARAARAAAVDGIAAHRPRALIYAATTAALLGPRPGAIWFDSPAAQNRPGRHGLWQRPVERRRFAGAPLLLPMSAEALAAAPVTAGGPGSARGAGAGAAPLSASVAFPRDGSPRGAGWQSPPAVVLPVPVEPSGPLGAPGERDIAALAYAADAEKKGLARILAAWARARRDGEELLVAGQPARALGPGARGTGLLPPAEYRALLRRARVFVAAPRHEDYGIAQLEALADGCRLVTAPASGPYPAFALARQLDPALAGDDLAAALRRALDAPDGDYAERALALLEPYRRAAFERTVAERVLPALL